MRLIFFTLKINLKYLWQLISVRRYFRVETHSVSHNHNILFNTSYHWAFSWFEYGLMKKLSKKNNITALVCDGMDYCELKTITTTKPMCFLCSNLTSHLCKSSGANVIKYSELINVKNGQELKDELFANNLKHFSKGHLKSISKNTKKNIASSAFICRQVSNKIFKKFKFDFTITANGKFIQTGYFIRNSLKNKTKVISYESYNSPHKMIIDINRCSVDQFIDKKHLSLKLLPNNSFLEKYALAFKKNQRLGKITPFLYHNEKAFLKKETIFQKYKFNINKKNRVLLLPNVTWDSTCLSMEGAFNDIENWLEKTVAFLIKRDIEIIVRAHPAESKVPFQLKSRYGVIKLLRDKFGHQKNLTLIDSYENLDTISLAKYCQKVVVFTSTIGLELPLYNIKPICPVKSYYTGFGFTHDVFSEKQYFEALSMKYKVPELSKNNLQNLYKIIFLNKEKGVFDMIKGKKWPVKNSIDLEQFSQNKIFDNIIDFIERKKSKFELSFY